MRRIRYDVPKVSGYSAADFILGLTVESLNGVRNRSIAGGSVREADPEFLPAHSQHLYGSRNPVTRGPVFASGTNDFSWLQRVGERS